MCIDAPIECYDEVPAEVVFQKYATTQPTRVK